MARTNNLLLQQISGALGRQIIFKQYYDQTVVSKMPDMSRRVLSEKQINWNERMALATRYAKVICLTAERKSQARIRLDVPSHKSVFRALVKENLDMCKHLSLEEAEEETSKMITKAGS